MPLCDCAPMDEPSATPWKIACAAALAVPLLWFGALAAGHDQGPACADHTGANGYAGPGFAILGSEPRPACIRDDLPPLGT
jgi:hypothetical protein